MAFTSTDLTNVETAISDLATGSRVVSVTVGDKVINYQRVDLPELYKLRGIIKADLGTSGDGGFFNKVQFDRPV